MSSGEENRLPVVADGNTLIHQYGDEDAREQIWSALVAWATAPRTDRLTKTDMIAVLNDEFPGLNLTEGAFDHAIRRYVTPAVPNMLPASVLHGLVDMGADLNTARTKAKVVDKLLAAIDRYDGEGKDTLAALANSVIKATESMEDTLERYQHIPSKKKMDDGPKTTVNLKLEGTLSRLGIAPVDVDAKDVNPTD